MEKAKHYYDVRFPARVVKEAYGLFLQQIDGNEDQKIMSPQDMSVVLGDEEWSFDSPEEFFAAYPKADTFRFDHIVHDDRFIVSGFSLRATRVDVRLSTRARIESVFSIFESALDTSQIVAVTDPVKIFIGHGRDNQWKDLKDHLHEHHGFEVVAYEIGPRAGLSVKEVLEEMLIKSSFAFLVLTGEDLHADGELHARENVIHELGLFQGKWGFRRAVALLEEGVKEFSNILGVNQIRFRKGNIRETFGDVLATVKREMEEQEKNRT